MKILRALWIDEAGFVITSELLVIVTILVLGVMVGLIAIRDAIVQELGDIAAAIGNLDQSYSFNGVLMSNGATTRGSLFLDAVDQGDLGPAATMRANAVPGATSVFVPPTSENGVLVP